MWVVLGVEMYSLYLHGEELFLSRALGLLAVIIVGVALAYRLFKRRH